MGKEESAGTIRPKSFGVKNVHHNPRSTSSSKLDTHTLIKTNTTTYGLGLCYITDMRHIRSPFYPIKYYYSLRLELITPVFRTLDALFLSFFLSSISATWAEATIKNVKEKKDVASGRDVNARNSFFSFLCFVYVWFKRKTYHCPTLQPLYRES